MDGRRDVSRVQDEGRHDLVLLNFASARNPGGGFINGARAQEEDIARASGLYPCLLQAPVYYDANRETRSLLYTDHLTYSPRVPFVRERNRRLLETPFLAS
ncbi:MAG: TIGR02452 family protein, partial [Myxococcota bacterium]